MITLDGLMATINDLFEGQKFKEAITLINDNQEIIFSQLHTTIPPEVEKHLYLNESLTSDWNSLIKREPTTRQNTGSAETNHKRSKIREKRFSVQNRLYKSENRVLYESEQNRNTFTEEKDNLENKYKRIFPNIDSFFQMYAVYKQKVKLKQNLEDVVQALTLQTFFSEENKEFQKWFDENMQANATLLKEEIQYLLEINKKYKIPKKDFLHVSFTSEPIAEEALKKKYKLLKATDLGVISYEHALYTLSRPEERKLFQRGYDKYSHELTWVDRENKSFNVNAKLMTRIRKGYETKDPEFLSAFKKLLTPLIHYWRLNGNEYDNILLNVRRTYAINRSIDAIEKILDRKFENSNVPKLIHILRTLKDEGIIQENELIPSISKTYLSEKITSQKEISPEQKAALVNERAFQNKPLLANTNALTITKRIDDTTSLEELTRESIYKREYANTADIELISYAIAMKCEPNIFAEKHLPYIADKLRLTMPFDMVMSHITKQEFEGPMKSIGMNGDITYQIDISEEMVFFSMEQTHHITQSMFERNSKIFVGKAIIEQYCKDTGIQYYSEHELHDEEKKELHKKIISREYEKQQKEHIVSKLSNERILDLIDFFSQNMACQVSLTDSENQYPAGKLIYDIEGYFPTDEILHIEGFNKLQLDINQLFILANEPNKYNQKTSELEHINMILDKTKEWKRQQLPSDCTDTYIKFLAQESEAYQASKDSWDFWEQTHGGISYTQEEYEKDENIRNWVDLENSIEQRVKTLSNRSEQIAQQIQLKAKMNLAHFSFTYRHDYKYALLNLQNSLLAQNYVSSTDQTKAITAAVKLIEEKQKKQIE